MTKWLLGVILALSYTLTTHLNVPELPPARELNCLVENVYHEARNQPILGQYAVVWVTMTRAKYYKNICKVVWQPKQFSWTSRKAKKISKADWVKTANIVVKALQMPNTLQATHYHNMTVKPKWKLKKVAVIGNHIFYQ